MLNVESNLSLIQSRKTFFESFFVLLSSLMFAKHQKKTIMTLGPLSMSNLIFEQIILSFSLPIAANQQQRNSFIFKNLKIHKNPQNERKVFFFDFPLHTF